MENNMHEIVTAKLTFLILGKQFLWKVMPSAFFYDKPLHYTNKSLHSIEKNMLYLKKYLVEHMKYDPKGETLSDDAR